MLKGQVNVMVAAAREYKELHLYSWARGVEVPSPWEWISAFMGNVASMESSWTPAKVEYAWHHGVSTLVPDIIILCNPSTSPKPLNRSMDRCG
jgi:hypothetical protein